MILSAIRTGHQRSCGEDLFFPASETPLSLAGKGEGAVPPDLPVQKKVRGTRRRTRRTETDIATATLRNLSRIVEA